MLVQQFPITTPYGWVQGYPLHTNPNDPIIPPDQRAKYPGSGYGFHTGIDYGCPDNTPVIVNGVQIGLSNHTGAAIGPHLHLGKAVNGVIADPRSGGLNFSSAVVTVVASDPVNGNYVKIRGDGADWIYDHLAVQSVNVGQTLQGGDMATLVDKNSLEDLAVGLLGHTSVGNKDLANWIGQPLDTALAGFIHYPEHQALIDRANRPDTPSNVKPYDGPPLFVKE